MIGANDVKASKVFYDAILDELGGRQLYLAYLRDPSGNKACALYRINY